MAESTAQPASHAYHFADFILHTPWPLDDLWPAYVETVGADDAILAPGEVPLNLHNHDTADLGAFCQANATDFLLVTPVARLLISRGREIHYTMTSGHPDTELRPFICGPALAVLCYQRGINLLHGTALGSPAGTVVLAGSSGAGKSTFAFALCQQGWTLLGDDVLPVRLEGSLLQVLTGSRHVYLWDDSARHFQLPVAQLPRVRQSLHKYAVSVAIERRTVPTTINALISLERFTGAGSGYRLLSGKAAFASLLTDISYRSLWADHLLQPVNRFQFVSQTLHNTPLYCLAYEHNFDKLGTLTDTLQSGLTQLEITSDAITTPN
jgi:hypothetical protein